VTPVSAVNTYGPVPSWFCAYTRNQYGSLRALNVTLSLHVMSTQKATLRASSVTVSHVALPPNTTFESISTMYAVIGSKYPPRPVLSGLSHTKLIVRGSGTNDMKFSGAVGKTIGCHHHYENTQTNVSAHLTACL